VLETPHVVVAAAIATKVANPALAIPLALGSHFVLEKIPHWNPHINTEMKKFGKISDFSKKVITADVALSLLLGFFIASLSLPDNTRALTVILTCFIAVTPDLIEAPYYLAGSKIDFIVKKWIPFKKSLQADTSFSIGILNQVLIIAAGFLWILS
jgi:hypothetical protein